MPQNHTSPTKAILSHSLQPHSLAESIAAIQQRICATGDLPHVTVSEQLALLTELSEFDLGRFLIQHKGVNGYWTHDFLTYPWFGKKTGRNAANQPLTSLERFLYEEAPLILATQERFTIFLAQNQQRLREGAYLASIPCGSLGELIYLDYKQVSHYQLYGIDNDPATLVFAQELVAKKNLTAHTTLLEADAWHLPSMPALDLISSNGLNIYEPDDERVLLLYQAFYRALKPGGALVTSFITPPPNHPKGCELNMNQINSAALLKQRIIFADVLQVHWQAYRTHQETQQQLEQAGFKQLTFIADKANMFPTVVAIK